MCGRPVSSLAKSLGSDEGLATQVLQGPSGAESVRGRPGISPALQRATPEVFFSRETPVAEFIEMLLRETRTSIEAALHQLDNPRLIRALEESSERGVRVRLLLDRTKFEEIVSTFPGRSNGRLSVRLLNGRLGPASRMHHKFALLDHRTVVTGSYNWTVGSDEQNYENLIILQGKSEVAAYGREFATLWREGTQAPQTRPPSRAAGRSEPGSARTSFVSGVTASSVTERGFRVYLMRHGPSVPGGKVNPRGTALSPLTPEGRKKVSEIAKGLIETGFNIDWIISSPWRQAMETAQLVAARLPAEVPVDSCEALLPSGPIEETIRFLRKRPDLRRVLIVGHEPGLSRLAARLTDCSEGANLKLKKGGCCLLRFDDPPSRGNGRLVWWLPPRLLRRLR
jgi:phosphohistidine phosphatase SixA